MRKLIEIALHIVLKPQLVADLDETGTDSGDDILTRHAVGDVRVTEIEKIRQLVVAGVALARRGADHNAPRGVSLDNGLDLFKLFGPRDRGAAEFRNL